MSRLRSNSLSRETIWRVIWSAACADGGSAQSGPRRTVGACWRHHFTSRGGLWDTLWARTANRLQISPRLREDNGQSAHSNPYSRLRSRLIPIHSSSCVELPSMKCASRRAWSRKARIAFAGLVVVVDHDECCAKVAGGVLGIFEVLAHLVQGGSVGSSGCKVESPGPNWLGDPSRIWRESSTESSMDAEVRANGFGLCHDRPLKPISFFSLSSSQDSTDSGLQRSRFPIFSGVGTCPSSRAW